MAEEHMSQFRKITAMNSLKWSCGMLIFCPKCKTALDCTRAVELTVIEEGDVTYCKAVCCDCFDGAFGGTKLELTRQEAEAKYGKRVDVEVIDGRVFTEEDWKLSRSL